MSSFACLPVLDSIHLILWVFVMLSRIFCMITLSGVGTNGPGLVSTVVLASLANLSAVSLPCTPECPGTHLTVTLLLSARLFRFSLHLYTSLDFILSEAMALIANSLSEHMWIFLSLISLSSSVAINIAKISACWAVVSPLSRIDILIPFSMHDTPAPACASVFDPSV
jgi:hypothetical protein